MVGRFGFSSAIAFDAQHLQPLATWAFLATLTEAVFIEGHRADDAIPHALGHSNRLGPHSGVYLITLSPTTSETQKIVNVTKYIWSHRDYRPWGTTLPVQCRECGTPQQWAGMKCSDNYTFECRYEFCGWDPVCQEFVKPRGTYVVEKPEGMQVIPNGKLPSSSWLRFCLPAKVIEADSEDLAMELD
ncbi:hypothetical protein HYDPIDRAFT_120151 [Hydnomerulius pinastri MD-312]|uniref:Uncharacterized protein n=1 Tax=Hydnomerulius pinastri MD-312 TaxID=994086 RepID=A0A0C9VKB7_9AGAM|nr:hypothetical protein HYDPIDRAFT_120151 [Hydnomerulius pinastri MD-312]